MKICPSPDARSRTLARRGYLLMELLFYIGLVMVVLGLAYALMYRLVDNSTVLRRNADDIAAAMRAGERWRADVRAAGQIDWLESEDGWRLRLQSGEHNTSYLFDGETVWRQVGDQPMIRLLRNVQASEMRADPRARVTAWSWDLELRPRAKSYTRPSKVRPLFTFTAVPERSQTP